MVFLSCGLFTLHLGQTRESGAAWASLAEVVKAPEWQPHSVRGAIAGALKKKLGLKVESEKVDTERGRVYRITE